MEAHILKEKTPLIKHTKHIIQLYLLSHWIFLHKSQSELVKGINFITLKTKNQKTILRFSSNMKRVSRLSQILIQNGTALYSFQTSTKEHGVKKNKEDYFLPHQVCWLYEGEK